ncbi:MYO16 protein, partial [Onychorhynchus coronatus]|nr:MYO16 protein [Onychorhynchus coronatus]
APGAAMVSLGERCPPPGGAEDLAALSELDEAALLSGLRERFLSQHIYTSIGDILIAVNPFQPLPLYGGEVSAAPPAAPRRPSAAHACPPPLPCRSPSCTGASRP